MVWRIWENSKFSKIYFKDIEEPLCQIVCEVKALFGNKKIKYALGKKEWVEIGRVMGWK